MWFNNKTNELRIPLIIQDKTMEAYIDRVVKLNGFNETVKNKLMSSAIQYNIVNPSSPRLFLIFTSLTQKEIK